MKFDWKDWLLALGLISKILIDVIAIFKIDDYSLKFAFVVKIAIDLIALVRLIKGTL